MSMTQSEYRKLASKKPSKYRNVKAEVDGHAFDSKAEFMPASDGRRQQ